MGRGSNLIAVGDFGGLEGVIFEFHCAVVVEIELGDVEGVEPDGCKDGASKSIAGIGLGGMGEGSFQR